MSEPHNGIGFSERKSPLSMKQILTGMPRIATGESACTLDGATQAVKAQRADRNSSIYADHIKSSGVVAVTNSRELLVQHPEVKTESDVDIAADILVKVFNSPNSRGFYCDCARHLD